jgi:hypothetical protein
MVSVLWVMTIGNSTSCWIRISGHTWPSCMNQFFGNIFPWPLETLYTKNVVNELNFLLVTHMTYFDIQFGCYEFLKSDFHTDQVLDRLVLHVLGQVFGLQDDWNWLRFEYTIWRSLAQLSNAWSNTCFWYSQPRLWPFWYNHVQS